MLTPGLLIEGSEQLLVTSTIIVKPASGGVITYQRQVFSRYLAPRLSSKLIPGERNALGELVVEGDTVYQTSCENQFDRTRKPTI